jgi:hypothetical protein
MPRIMTSSEPIFGTPIAHMLQGHIARLDEGIIKVYLNSYRETYEVVITFTIEGEPFRVWGEYSVGLHDTSLESILHSFAKRLHDEIARKLHAYYD